MNAAINIIFFIFLLYFSNFSFASGKTSVDTNIIKQCIVCINTYQTQYVASKSDLTRNPTLTKDQADMLKGFANSNFLMMQAWMGVTIEEAKKLNVSDMQLDDLFKAEAGRHKKIITEATGLPDLLRRYEGDVKKCESFRENNSELSKIYEQHLRRALKTR